MQSLARSSLPRICRAKLLRKEAKTRGLSSSGNKGALISRIQKHDDHATLEAISHKVPISSGTTDGTGVTPGIPMNQQPNEPPPIDFLNVKIPDIQKPYPESVVQIPFVPDHWESSKVKQEEAVRPGEPILPKLLVVAGDSQPGGPPTHNLLDTTATVAELPVEKTSIEPASKQPNSFWQDVAEDVGLPTSFSYGSAPEKTAETFESRTSDDSQDSSRGVWVVLGLLTGSWIVGGIVNN